MTAADLNSRLDAVESRIASACAAAGRARDEVRLLPVSKTWSAEQIAPVVAAGHHRLAENRVQEVVAKAPDLPEVSWVLIGPLQTNKVTKVVDLVTEFQALDSPRLAEALDRRLQTAGRSLDVLVQVNTSGEASKSGLAPDEVEPFCATLAQYASLRPRGLMTIATLGSDPAEAERCFGLLADLRNRLRDNGVGGSDWPELSMGMSADLEQAIAHGATQVRVGRAIFGERG